MSQAKELLELATRLSYFPGAVEQGLAGMLRHLAAAPQPESTQQDAAPIEEQLKLAYYYNEDGEWRTESSEWDRWHAVAKVARSAITASGCHADARSSVQHSGQRQDAKDAALYRELLYAVSKKWPGESRHKTVLRYIRRAEEEGSKELGATIRTQGTEG